MSPAVRSPLWVAAVAALIALTSAVLAQKVTFSANTGPYDLSALTTRGIGDALEMTVSPIGPRPTPTVTPTPNPADGVFVYSADPTCTYAGSSSVVAPLAPAVCMRAAALEWLRAEVEFGRLIPGPAWRDCSRGTSWTSCLEYAFLRYAPEIRYQQSAKWIYGDRLQQPGWYCAAGISYQTYIRVSLAQSTYRLVAWETLNSALRYRLDRADITDSSAVVGVGVNAAAAACGVQ